VPDAASLVAEIAGRLRPLEVELSLAWWEANTRGSEETERRRTEAELRLREALADGDAFAAVSEARAAGAGAGHPLLGRQLERLFGDMQPNQLDESLRRRLVELETLVEGVYNTHRGDLDGERVDDNHIAQVLVGSDDVAVRRAAWEASKSVGPAVAGFVVELVRLRNQAARSLGYPDHYAMALALGELDEGRLLATLDDVDRATAGPFAAWKAGLDAQRAERFGCGREDLRPWHYDDPFFQEAPRTPDLDLDPHFAGADLEALTVRTYDGMGIDLRPVLARSDLYAREGKSQHAFCIDIDRRGDVRVLCNVMPNERWMGTMLHEFGHAAYDRGIDDDLPFLLHGPAHMLTTEAVAMLLGHLTREPAWLEQVAGMGRDEAARLEPALRDGRRAAALVFARWALVVVHFERSLYRNPDGDHDRLWWDLVERFQEVSRPDGRSAPDWAAKIHLALTPVYYQNYLYGELAAAQMGAALRRDTGGLVDRAEAGQWLQHRVFGLGASRRWDHLVAEATGQRLSAEAFVEECTAGR
jgi:peptidyl-dipeptidase A